jgi:hypothetical protein
MTTHVLEARRSNGATVTLKEPHVENIEVDRSYSAMTAASIARERRCKAREDYRCGCSCEMVDAIDGELAYIEQGEAFALNRSAEGILLMMGCDRQAEQLIEVQTSHARWGLTEFLYQVRWTRPIRVESLGSLYLVGCRRVFGPYHARPSD